jgi:hypothetical protein
MIREESQREGDSGWSFMAGNEDDEFLENYKNIELLSIASISCQIKVRGECIMDNKMRIMSEEFENTTTGEKVTGVTVMIDGKLKQMLDIMIKKVVEKRVI